MTFVSLSYQILIHLTKFGQRYDEWWQSLDEETMKNLFIWLQKVPKNTVYHQKSQTCPLVQRTGSKHLRILKELFLFFEFSLFKPSVNSEFIMKTAKMQIILMEFSSKQEPSGQGYAARIVQNCHLPILNQNISRYRSEHKSSWLLYAAYFNIRFLQ